MKMKKMGIKFFVLGFLLFFAWASVGMAADYPQRSIRVIIPYSAGGGTDFTCRVFQSHLEKILGQKVLVENMPGGSTKAGTMEVMKAKPDGYTLLYTGMEAWVGYYYSGTYKENERVWEQLVPIGTTNASYSWGFLEVRAESPFKTWADLVKAAKENPGKLTCGGPGAGGMTELMMNLINEAAGIKTVYVPFAGAAKSGAAVYGGHTDLRICGPEDAVNMYRAGKSRGLAIHADQRIKAYPDVPTFKELGLPGGDTRFISGFWGPPKLPLSIVNTLTHATQKGTEQPDFVNIIIDKARIVLYLSPEQMKHRMKDFEKEFGQRLKELYKK